MIYDNPMFNVCEALNCKFPEIKFEVVFTSTLDKEFLIQDTFARIFFDYAGLEGYIDDEANLNLGLINEPLSQETFLKINSILEILSRFKDIKERLENL